MERIIFNRTDENKINYIKSIKESKEIYDVIINKEIDLKSQLEKIILKYIKKSKKNPLIILIEEENREKKQNYFIGIKELENLEIKKTIAEKVKEIEKMKEKFYENDIEFLKVEEVAGVEKILNNSEQLSIFLSQIEESIF